MTPLLLLVSREDQVFPILDCFHFSVPLSICEDRLCERIQGWETTERVPGRKRVVRTTRRTWDEDNCMENDFIYPESGRVMLMGQRRKSGFWTSENAAFQLLSYCFDIGLNLWDGNLQVRTCVARSVHKRKAEIMQMNRSREEIALQDPARNDTGRKFVCFTLTRSWWSLLLS